MRDIRDDLHERLRMLDGAYADEMARFQEESTNALMRHRHKLGELERARDVIKRLLEFEDRCANTEQNISTQETTPSRIPLMEFLILKIEEEGPLSKLDLHGEAKIAGYFQEIDGRTFHTTLMNMVRANRVRVDADRCYAPVIKAPGMFDNDRESDMQKVN
jgi:hypothetical protein